MCQFWGKTNNFDYLRPNLTKNGFWGQNFKNLSLDSESAPPRYHVCQFLVKMSNFELFGLNLGNCPITCDILVRILLKALQSWAEAEMSWVEVEMSCVEVDGAGWSWVELGSRFSNTCWKTLVSNCANDYAYGVFVTESLSCYDVVIFSFIISS